MGSKSGVFERVFKLLAAITAIEYMMIDATTVRAHQHSAGAKKRRRASHRSIPRRIDALRQARQDFHRRRSARLRDHPPQLNTGPNLFEGLLLWLTAR
jgi:hypothetical protein